jgi:hypothetical protein
MITKPTVLILGAGASMPFGFPSSSDLKTEIVSLQEKESELMRLLLASDFKHDEIVDFAKTLGASLFLSVDRFLEFTLGSYRRIGCAAIAAEILLKSRDLAMRRDFDWMGILFSALAPQFEEELYDDRLTVVTYNYDCSFEHLLWKGLQSSIQIKRAQETFDKIKVIHLHGKLAPSTEPRQLLLVCPQVVKDSFEDLENGIVASHERNPDTAQFRQAREILHKANRVCFLGFGYDCTNLERLLGGPNTRQLADKFVCGSAYNRTSMENWNVNKEYFDGTFRFGKSDWETPEFLRESSVLERICNLPRQESPILQEKGQSR